jgi:hypothetical protein
VLWRSALGIFLITSIDTSGSFPHRDPGGRRPKKLETLRESTQGPITCGENIFQSCSLPQHQAIVRHLIELDVLQSGFDVISQILKEAEVVAESV